MYVTHSIERRYLSLLQQKMQRLLFLLGSSPIARRGGRSAAASASCSARLSAAAGVAAAAATATSGALGAGRPAAAAAAARLAHTREVATFKDSRICSSSAVSTSPQLPSPSFFPRAGASSSRPFTVSATHAKQQQVKQEQTATSSCAVEPLASFESFESPAAGAAAEISTGRPAATPADAAVTPAPLSTTTAAFASYGVGAAAAPTSQAPDFQRASVSAAATASPSSYISAAAAPGSAAPVYHQPAAAAAAASSPVYNGKALPPLTHPTAATHVSQSSAGGAAAGNTFSPSSVTAAAAAATAIPHTTVSSATETHPTTPKAPYATPHYFSSHESAAAAREVVFSAAAGQALPRSSFAASYTPTPQQQQQQQFSAQLAAAATVESDGFSPPRSSDEWGMHAGTSYSPTGWPQQQQQQQIPSAVSAFSAASAAGRFAPQQQQQQAFVDNSSRAAGSVPPAAQLSSSSSSFPTYYREDTWQNSQREASTSCANSSFLSQPARSGEPSFSRAAAAAAPGIPQQKTAAATAPGSGSWTEWESSSSSYRSSSSRERPYQRPRRGEKQQQQQSFAGSRLIDIAWQKESLAPIKKNFYKETAAVAARSTEEVETILRDHHMHLECYNSSNSNSSSRRDDLPKPVLSFEEAGFPEVILKQLQRMQFHTPTAIQKIGWPVALSGRDLIGIAQTGSGKTLGFLLPGLVHAAAQPPLQQGEGPLVLVLAPTRELAMQIRHECNRFTSGLLADSAAAAEAMTTAKTATATAAAAAGTAAAAAGTAAAAGGLGAAAGGVAAAETGDAMMSRLHGTIEEQTFFSSSSSSNWRHRFRTACVYGGVPRQGQAAELRRGAEIVIATPGRLLDFLDLGVTNLKRVSYVVLDEADRMMDMGFEPQVRKLFSQIRPDRQTLLWSATWPKEVRELAKAFCRTQVVKLQIGDAELQANASVAQRIEVVSPGQLQQRLLEVLQQIAGNKVLIFCETKRQCEQLCRELRYRQKRALAIHGDKEQRERDRILHDFRVGHCEILVATDVASRGLDIKDVRFVINYEIPKNIESYIHRIGRTGRAGNTGTAISFFEYDYYQPEKVNMAKRICDVMRGVGQDPPQELVRIAKS